MKSVLISIQPKWVEKIASGQKTIEVRKTRPKIETPFKCYIYMTKNGSFKDFETDKNKLSIAQLLRKQGKVIGEFVCDRIDNYECELWNDEAYELIRQFNYDEYGEIEYEHGAENNENCEILNKACLTWQDIRKYLGQGLNNCYAWHISNLKIYDKPKELSEFYPIKPKRVEKWTDKDACAFCKYHRWEKTPFEETCLLDKPEPICEYTPPNTRPPQSYMFVESLGE